MKPSAADSLDVARIDPKSLEAGEFPVVDSPDFRIHMSPSTHEKILAHAKESTRVEVCGILVGKPRRDKQGAWLEIVDVIRGEHAASQGAQVTFTHKTWDHINSQMDTKFKDQQNVGWYHTHPGFGVFLSNFDTFIHQSYFDHPKQVAFVVDPIHGEEGFFVWKQGKTAPARVFWIGNRVVVSDPRPEGGEEGMREDAPAKKEAAAEREPVEPRPARSGWGDLLTIVLALFCGIALGLWLGDMQARAYVGMLEAKEIHRLVQLGVMRIGLAQDLTIVAKALEEIRIFIAPTSDSAGPTPEKARAAAEDLAKVQGMLAKTVNDFADLESQAIARIRAEGKDLITYEEDLDRVKSELRSARKAIAETLVDKAKAELAAGHKDEAKRWFERALETWQEGKDELKKAVPELAEEGK